MDAKYFLNRWVSDVAEGVMLQARRNVSERSNALGLKCIGRFVVEDVGTALRWHDAIATS